MLPALHGELWKPDMNSLFRDNYNCFLAGKNNLFHSSWPSGGWAVPGAVPGPQAPRKRGHPDPGIFLPQDESGGNILLVCSIRAKQQQGQTFQALGDFIFFLSLLGFPEALSCFQSWVLGLFLSCAVSAPTKTPERACIYSPLSVETGNECTIHQGKPKGSWYPDLSDSNLKNKPKSCSLASGGTERAKSPAQNTTWTQTNISSLPPGKPRTCLSVPWQTRIFAPVLPAELPDGFYTQNPKTTAIPTLLNRNSVKQRKGKTLLFSCRKVFFFFSILAYNSHSFLSRSSM